MTRYILFPISFLLALAAHAQTEAPCDTLLNVATTGSISIVSSERSASITVNKIDGGTDNFYYQSGNLDKNNRFYRTNISCQGITSVLVCERPTDVKVDFVNESGYPQSYTFTFSDPDNRNVKSYIGPRGTDFGFTISRSKTTEWEVISQGLALGWVSPLNEATALNSSMWRSTELSWLMIVGVRMRHRAQSLSMGLGINWQNIVLKGDRYFHKNADCTITLDPYEPDMTDRRSRLKIFSLQVPVLYGLNFGHKRYLGVQFGPIVNFNTGGSIKTQYKYDGSKYSVKTTGIGQRPVTVDLFASFNYRAIGWYVRYSPMKKLRDRADLGFSTISTGIMLGF